MKSRLIRSAIFVFLPALLMSCGDDTGTPPASNSSEGGAASPSLGQGATGVTLTASPNPVPAGGGAGKATIKWSASGHPDAQVYVYTDAASGERLFAAGSAGSADAPWIQSGTTYEFRLYASKHRQERLATLQVTRESH